MHKNDKVIELEQKIISARNDYYNTGNCLIADDVYDLWLSQLSKLDPENILLSQVGAEPVSEWVKEQLPIQMLSLDKAQNEEQFMDWYNKYKQYPLCVSDKLDGISILCEYNNGKFIKAITRGGSNGIGENISSNVIKMIGVSKQLPIDFTGYIRGEIVLTKENHKKYFADYSNPRNAASGIARRYDGEGAEYLSVYFYNVFSDMKFDSQSEIFLFISNKLELQIPNYAIFIKVEEAINFWQTFKEKFEEDLPYIIDGLVCSYSDIAYQNSLGNTSHHPRGAIAMKFPPELKETKLIDVIWQSGNSNRITPVAVLEPVSIAGTTVQRASLHNCSNIKRLGATLGATVIISKRNEIIPFVEEVLQKTDKEIIIPVNCPSCNALTEMSGEYLICPNISACPAQKSGRILNWVKALNLLEWGTVLGNNVVEYGGVQTIVDLYKLTVEDLEKLPRMGKKSATRAYDILHSNKTIKLENFFGGLSLPMIGETIVKLIMAAGYDSVDKIMAMSVNDFENISGIGPIKAKTLYKGLRENEVIIKQLLEVGIMIKEQETAVGGKFDGMTFVFTGTMQHVREELIEMVNANGGTVKNSVGKSLSYLVCEDETTTKYKKAVQFGVKIISEQEFLAMVE